eukprot:1792824-Rhodomonas_salina.8
MGGLTARALVQVWSSDSSLLCRLLPKRELSALRCIAGASIMRITLTALNHPDVRADAQGQRVFPGRKGSAVQQR